MRRLARCPHIRQLEKRRQQGERKIITLQMPASDPIKNKEVVIEIQLERNTAGEVDLQPPVISAVMCGDDIRPASGRSV